MIRTVIMLARRAVGRTAGYVGMRGHIIMRFIGVTSLRAARAVAGRSMRHRAGRRQTDQRHRRSRHSRHKRAPVKANPPFADRRSPASLSHIPQHIAREIRRLNPYRRSPRRIPPGPSPQIERHKQNARSQRHTDNYRDKKYRTLLSWCLYSSQKQKSTHQCTPMHGSVSIGGLRASTLKSITQ